MSQTIGVTWSEPDGVETRKDPEKNKKGFEIRAGTKKNIQNGLKKRPWVLERHSMRGSASTSVLLLCLTLFGRGVPQESYSGETGSACLEFSEARM